MTRTQLTAFLQNERTDIASQQRRVLARGSINNQADLRTFCRLEGRLEQLIAVEAWLAAVDMEVHA